MINPTPVPSNVPTPQPAQSALTTQQLGGSGARIKAEPDTENYKVPQYTGYEPNYNSSNEAHQRAAAAMRQKFGPDAEAQIQQLQRQSGDPHHIQRPAAHPGNIQLPPQLSEQQRREYADRQRQQQTLQMRQSQQAQQRPAVGNGQTDGADDWSAMVARHRADMQANPNATYEADMTLRELSKQANLAMEGGGLMVPLSERPERSQAGKPKPKPRGAIVSNPSKYSVENAQTRIPDQRLKIPQLDGLDSDDETKGGIKPESDLDDDEDAINSDLDDPEDDVVGEERDDEDDTEIMACTYDKVARVKNKWKCTLKDGILNTGSKE